MSSDFTATPDLPPDWERPRLAEVVQINPPLDRCIIADNVSVNFAPMRAVEVEGGGLLYPEARAYSEVKKGYTSFLSGDVIMAKITPCMENGKTTVVPELPDSVCFGSTEFHVLRPELDIEPRWIENFLLQHDTRRAAQRAMTGGVGQMRVPASFLEAVRIPLAPAQEQIRIADTLDEMFSDIDGGVAALRRAMAKLELYRAAVLKAAVEGALTSEWRQQHPKVESATELLRRILAERRHRWEGQQLRNFEEKRQTPPKNWKEKYKEPAPPDTANLGPLPDGWCWTRAEQLCGFITKGTTPPGADSPQAFGDIPFIKVQHLSEDGVFHFSESPSFVSEHMHDGFLSRSKVLPGDVLMNIVGPPLGQVCVVPETFREWNVNQAIAIFRPIEGISNGLLALFLVSLPVMAQALKRAKTTAGQVNLTLEVCRDLCIPLPPAAEQEGLLEAVEDQLSLIEHLEKEINAKLGTAQALRQSILCHAFTGQLAPQDPNDEPASELLKRIAAERDARAEEAAGAKRASVSPKKKTAKVP